MNILVAEDNSDSRKLLVKQLHAYGHTVTGTANGSEALAAALENPPDIVVADILMPEMDGFQLCVEWKARPELKERPLVFYSATYTSDEDERFAMSLGADAFIRKPAEIDEFVRTISMVVERAAAGSPRQSEFGASDYGGFFVEYSKRLFEKLCNKVAQLETDIVERRKVQEELHLKAQLLEAATDIIYVTDLAWTLLYVNEAACTNLGYSREEMVGHNLREFTEPDYLERVRSAGVRNESIIESAYVRRDGTVVPVEVHHRVIDWDGKSVRLAVVRDITERKKAEERLLESNTTLQRVLQGTIGVIEQIVEVSDPYTAGHQRRVAELAVAIARRMKLPEESCVALIHTAAVIHDIGKTTVPAEILSRPGRLSEAEFGLIKCHPETGHDIIRRASLPDPVADVVLQHHERLDGSGYPRGLTGDEILPEAQILAVADVVEAMSSHRPYRPALGLDAALQEISSGRGTRFDADVVDACVAVFRQDGFEFSDSSGR